MRPDIEAKEAPVELTGLKAAAHGISNPEAAARPLEGQPVQPRLDLPSLPMNITLYTCEGSRSAPPSCADAASPAADTAGGAPALPLPRQIRAPLPRASIIRICPLRPRHCPAEWSDAPPGRSAPRLRARAKGFGGCRPAGADGAHHSWLGWGLWRKAADCA